MGKQTSAHQVGAYRKAIPLECRTLLFEDSVSLLGSLSRAEVQYVYRIDSLYGIWIL